MAENENGSTQTPVGGDAEASGPQVGVITQYIKDLSFENPNAPASLQNNSGKQPALEVNVNVGVKKVNDEVFEVELKISATAKVGEDETAFVVELLYGTLFGMRGVPEEAMQPFLLIQAPTLMFPFARRIIADATRDGGFPPLLLEPISFEALFQQQMAQQQAQAAAATDGAATEGSDDPAPINLN